MISPFGARTTGNAWYAAQVKNWTAQMFQLSEEVSIMVTELRCTEAGCPPLETVIAILDRPGQPRQFKLHKALREVTPEDVQALAND